MTAAPLAQVRLLALLQQRQHQPFAWGLRDCFCWAADMAHAATGHDPAAGLRGTYATARQARRLFASLGGWAGMACTRFGTPIATAQVQDGDLALLHAGVCTGLQFGQAGMGAVWQGAVVAQGARGLVQLPLAAAGAFWRGARTCP